MMIPSQVTAILAAAFMPEAFCEIWEAPFPLAEGTGRELCDSTGVCQQKADDSCTEMEGKKKNCFVHKAIYFTILSIQIIFPTP